MNLLKFKNVSSLSNNVLFRKFSLSFFLSNYESTDILGDWFSRIESITKAQNIGVEISKKFHELNLAEKSVAIKSIIDKFKESYPAFPQHLADKYNEQLNECESQAEVDSILKYFDSIFI